MGGDAMLPSKVEAKPLTVAVVGTLVALGGVLVGMGVGVGEVRTRLTHHDATFSAINANLGDKEVRLRALEEQRATTSLVIHRLDALERALNNLRLELRRANPTGHDAP
jgi:hypothetical protein